MNFDQFELNNNGNLSFQTDSGKSININGNDINNREIIRGVLNSRLDFINPQIGDFKERFSEAVSMTPIERAEFDFFKLRVTHLEKEKSSLLNIVSELKTSSDNSNQLAVVKHTKLGSLKIKMKTMVKDSEIKKLYNVVDENVSQDSRLYNQFVANFSSYGRLNSEDRTGTIPRNDFSISLNHVTLSLLSLIDELKKDDLKTESN